MHAQSLKLTQQAFQSIKYRKQQNYSIIFLSLNLEFGLVCLCKHTTLQGACVRIVWKTSLEKQVNKFDKTLHCKYTWKGMQWNEKAKPSSVLGWAQRIHMTDGIGFNTVAAFDPCLTIYRLDLLSLMVSAHNLVQWEFENGCSYYRDSAAHSPSVTH